MCILLLLLYYAVVLIGLVVSRKISGYLPCPASNRFLCTNTYLHKNFMRIDTAFKVIVVENVIITTVIQAAVSLCSKRSFENLESRFGTIAQLFNSQDRHKLYKNAVPTVEGMIHQQTILFPNSTYLQLSVCHLDYL